ncbi:lipopolysaccharide biosynthesis protein [Enterovibrio makurazakiensis]|uniref:lipopolysaccharide biosynthesis protein n=1 Tax=Enterovibrio makurazakiensis TaxID=2910232 RepID=UPI003D21BA39
MTTETIEKVETTEQRFLRFKQSIKPAQFNNAVFLTRQADAVKETDPALSIRILQRVQNLQKNAATQTARKIKKQTQVKDENPKESAPVLSSPKSSDEELTASSPSPSSLVEGKTEVAVEVIESSIENVPTQTEAQALSQSQQVLSYIKRHPFILFVVLPVFIFALYQIFWASPRYESRTQIIVQQPDGMATMDAGMALLSGLGVNTANSDTQLVKAYVYSNDMLEHLNSTLNLREHFESREADFFSRMHSWDTIEDFVDYFASRVSVEIDEKSQVITVSAQSFTPSFATTLAKAIADKAEWYINNIGHQLAEAQLAFIKEEHTLIERRLKSAQSDLLKFQQQHNLLNPEAEGSALAKIAYGIEGQIAARKAELKALQSIMSPNAPQVVNLKNQINALQAQLKLEKERLTTTSELRQSNTDVSLSVSEVLARYADLKIELELALKGFASSTISLEKSRIEAYRQLKYLVLVEEATNPEDNSYPTVIYNITLLAILLILAYWILRICVSTINEIN